MMIPPWYCDQIKASTHILAKVNRVSIVVNWATLNIFYTNKITRSEKLRRMQGTITTMHL